MSLIKNKVVFTYVPAIIDLLSQIAFINFEAILLGRFSPEALAGGGTGGQVLLFLFIFLLTFAMGSSLLISLELGKGNKEKANEIFTRSTIYVFSLGLIWAILGYIFTPFIFENIFRADPKTTTLAKLYFKTLSLFLPLIATNFFIISLIRGTGETIKSMSLNIIVNLINGFLSYIFIYGKLGIVQLGVKGAAIAIGLSHTIGLIISLFFILRSKTKLNFRLKRLRKMNLPILFRLLKVGIPATIEQFLWGIGQLFLIALITRRSTEELAVMQALLRIQMFVGIVYQAIGIVSLSFWAKAIAQKNTQEIITHTRTAFRLSILSAILFGAIFGLIPNTILSMFFKEKDTIRLGISVLRFIALLQISKALVVSISSLLRAKGDFLWLVGINCLFVLIFEISLGYILVTKLGYGIFGAWAVMGLDESIKTLVHLRRVSKTGINRL